MKYTIYLLFLGAFQLNHFIPTCHELTIHDKVMGTKSFYVECDRNGYIYLVQRGDMFGMVPCMRDNGEDRWFYIPARTNIGRVIRFHVINKNFEHKYINVPMRELENVFFGERE